MSPIILRSHQMCINQSQEICDHAQQLIRVTNKLIQDTKVLLQAHQEADSLHELTRANGPAGDLTVVPLPPASADAGVGVLSGPEHGWE